MHTMVPMNPRCPIPYTPEDLTMIDLHVPDDGGGGGQHRNNGYQHVGDGLQESGASNNPHLIMTDLVDLKRRKNMLNVDMTSV